MRLLRFDALAFGPFSGQSLALDEGRHGLHVVYGPNEAGKSSSLRALRQWLYGIPHNSSDNFIHSHQNLRIGGLLESADGRRLEFIRRKGRTKTLRGLDDAEVIAPSLLDDMLGGVDEATFGQRFGIDYDELRKGGEAVVRGGGDLGEILFAAGAGVADLGLIQKRLDDEADELFKARGSVQKINKAVSQLADARRAIKEAQLLTSEWSRHDKALRDAEKRQAEIDLQLREKRSEQHRLERIGKSLPLIGRRQRLDGQLAEVADARLLPDDFSGNRREAVTQLAGAKQAEREASQTIEKIRDDVDKLNVPTGLLEHGTAISQLHTELGSYQKAAKDRPRLVAELESAERQARKILEELGRPPQLDRADQLRLSRAQRQRIQSLAGECKARLDKVNSADQTARKLRDEIERIEFQLAELPSAKDAAELKRAIRRVQKHGDLDQQLAESRAQLRQLEEQAEVDLNRLRLFRGTLSQLEQLPTPAMETVDRFDNELADAETAVKRVEERIDELTRHAQNLDQSLEKLRLEHDVPSEDDLAEARRRRDSGWQLVRQSWLDGLPPDDPAAIEFVGEFTPSGNLDQAFQASIEAADNLADRLRREADRVAQKAKLTADRRDLDRQLDEQKEQLSLAENGSARLQAEWRDQWTDLNIEPLSPREMRSWLNQQTALADAVATIRKQRDAIDATAATVQSLHEQLNECLARLDETPASEDETLGATLDRCEAVVGAIETANEQRRGDEKRLSDLRDKLIHAQQEAEQSNGHLEQWRIDWAAAVAAIGLERDAAPSDANLVIESVDELFSVLKDVGELRHRIEGIDRDAGQFERSVRRLLEQVAEDLLEQPGDQAVADVYDRLEAAGKAQTKLEGWQDQFQREEAKRDHARANIERFDAEIKAMCQQAGCSSADDLPAAEERSKQRREIETELRTVNQQLDELAAGAPLEQWIADAQQFDPDKLQADVQRLGTEISEMERETTEVAEAIGSHRNELRRMDGSGRAAEAQEEAEHLLARIRSDAEQYIRLRLASAVLRRSIERFREASQGPVLARAGELFAELTLGSFEGLRADYDEKGDAVLVGVRAGGGQPVGVDGMSNGTCDQLYLALRLAMLESYASRREPLPFIVDDVLIMFDDDRAVAALKALARLSELTQVIFFTHHDHLVRLARENLDDDVLFTHTLDHRAAATPKASG